MRRDVFGRGGDFITSPEISQMFGELLGIWTVSLWRDLGCPKPFRLVELGPGRGTLTADLLKVAKKFREFNAAISIHFVEVSPTLRDLQASKLGLKYPEQRTRSAPSKGDKPVLLPNDSGSRGMRVQRSLDPSGDFSDLLEDVKLTTSEGIEVYWHQRIQDVPAGPSAIIAQEFFDALPVHQFEYTKDGWRERLVDVDPTPSGPHWFRYTLAPSASFASTSFLKNIVLDRRFKVGDTIEVSPDAMATAQIIGNRLARHGGAAVLIDYGENGAPAFSLRVRFSAMRDDISSDTCSKLFSRFCSFQAIKDHKFVDIFQEPGDADLSVNVDFAAIKSSAKQSLTSALSLSCRTGPS
jgi:NADH dehydrogenase [ubiquinone] 1 alpha subcomplex assembly factor 7